MQSKTLKTWVMVIIFICMALNVYAEKTQDAIAEKIPDILIPFDTENITEYMIVVEKQSQTLFVYEYNGNLKEIYKVKCSTGKNKGPKTRSGDSKTPEGVYFFIKEYKDKELAPIYGIGAFPTDYPNLMDKITEKTGNAIWLHGTNKELKDRDSNGCIVLENSQFQKVKQYITLNRTPIIIVDKLSHENFDAKAKIKTSLVNFLGNWVNSIKNGTYHDYVNFYDSEYVPDISWWTEWNKTRKNIKLPNAALLIEYKKLCIFQHKKMYVMLFDLYIKLSDKTLMAGTKKLFLTKIQDQIKIIGENYQKVPEKIKSNENPFIVTSRNLLIPSDKIEKTDQDKEIPIELSNVENLVDNWLKAWSAKDIKKYGFYYAKDFRSQGMNKKAWLNYKSRLNNKYKYIQVTKKNLKAKARKNKIIVSFVQNYKSNAFKTVGIKKLILKNEQGQWKIYRETFN